MKNFFPKFSFALVIGLLIFINNSYGANISSTAGGGNWNATTSWVGGVVPVAADNVTIVDGATITVSASSALCTNLTVGGGTSGILNVGGFIITVTGTTTVMNGANLNITSVTAVKTFADVTINSGGIWNNSGNSAITISGSLSNSGTFTSGTGAYTFSGAAKTFSGTTTPTTLAGGVVITGTYTNNISTLTITGVLSGAGTLTMGTSTTLNLGGATTTITGLTCTTNTPNTVVYNGAAAQTTKNSATTYYNLTINPGAGITTTQGAASTVNNNLTVSSNTFATGAFALTVTTATSVTGTLSINNATGTKALGPTTINSGGAINSIIGATITASSLTISSGGTWSTATAAAAVTISGDLSNSGTFTNSVATTYSIAGNIINSGTTFTSGAGTYTLTGAAKTLSGTSTPTTFSGAVAMPGTYTNNISTLTITGVLSGAGTLTMGTSTTLNLGGATTTITGINCTTNTPNTVVYQGVAAQTMKATATTYYNLTINPSVGITTSQSGVGATVNNNLSVLSGTFADAGLQVTGNATGTFSVAAGAAYTTTRTVTPWLPTAFITGNISLANTSGFNYSGAASFTIPTSQVTTYGVLGISGGGTKTLAAATTVYGIAINSGTLADGGFQITGNAAGTFTAAAATGLTLGTVATPTSFPTNFVNANITLNTTNVVTYNSNVAQTISNVPTYGALTTVATGAVTKTLGGNTSITGNFTNGSNNTFDVAGFNFTIGGTYSNSGTMTANAATSTLTFNGSSGQSLTIGLYTGTLVSNLVSSNTLAASGLSIASNLTAGTVTVNASSYLLINSGITLSATGNVSNAGTLMTNSGTATLAMTGSVAQTISGAGVWSVLGTGGRILNLTINNTSGANPAVSLNVNLAIVTALNLTTGILGGSGTLTIGIAATAVTTTRDVGTLANVPTFGYTTGAYNITYTGATAVTTANEIPSAVTPTNGTFTVNKSGGVTMSHALTVTTLTMTSGILTTTSGLITVAGTAAANVTGGSATSFVYGPLARTFTTTSTGTNLFPVGKAAYQLYELLSPVISAGSVVLTVEEFDAAAGGTDGIGFTAAGGPSKYWSATVSGGGTISSAGTLRLSDASITGASTSAAIGNSSAVSGTYNSVGSASINSPANSISSSATVPVAFGYFKIGVKGCLGSGATPTVYTVGTGAQFSKLSDVANILNSALVCGNIVFEFQSTYDGTTGEIFPITFNTFTYSGAASWNVTVRPASGVSLRTTSGTPGSAVNFISMNGASHLTFDGRAGGTGSTIAWLLRNMQTAVTYSSTIQLINDATVDTLEYLQVESQNQNASSGTIFLSTTTSTTGNDNIVIDHCTIRDRSDAAGYPATAIFASGTNTVGKENNSCIITNNNIYNFGLVAGATDHGGINIQTGNFGWTITGNSIYQTSSKALAGSEMDGINIANTSGYGFIITNNYIGGNAPSCGGAAFTITGTAKFRGIRCSTSSTLTATSIQGNTIQNISVTTSSASTSNAGISLASGQYNCGTTAANIIGSQSVAGSITYSSSAATCAFSGINMTSATIGTVSISNNQIGGIAGAGASTSTQIFGVYILAGYSTVQSNLITTLTNTSATVTANGTSSIIGIGVATATSGQVTLQQNTIHSLSNSTAGAVSVVGICVYPSTGATTTLIARNSIHSFSTTSTTAIQNGINISSSGTASGVVTAQNNVIRLGIDAAGASVTTSASIIGIYKNTTLANNFVFNSVYIGGSSVVGGAVNCAAFQRAATGADEIKNNIFVNARSRTSGTASYYAYILNATTTATSDYNIFYAPGTGGVLSSIAATPYTTLQAHRANLASQDLHSGVGDPNFVLATGTSSTVNLNLNNATPAEGSGGTTAVTVTDDFTGATRASFSPIDIGAYAGNYNSLVAATDIFTPNISYTTLTNQAVCASTVTLTATITDVGTGVPTSGGNVPRIYFRRSVGAGAITAWASAAGTLASGNGNNGTWNFVINYSLLTPTTLAVADVYQYYVVAQDQATNAVNPNIWFSKFDATTPVFTNNNVNAQTTAPTTLDSYTILNGLTGTVYVGTGAGSPSYPTFNGASGLFQAINNGVLIGNLTVIVQNNVTEITTTGLNTISYSCGGPYKITVQPDGTTTRVVSGSVTSALIQMSGADSVTFDGNFSGAGRYLRFQNQNGTTANVAATFYLTGDSRRITVKNCDIEGFTSNLSSGVVFIGAGTTLGNDYFTLDNCLIHEKTNAFGGYPIQLIYSNGSASATNDNETISNNNIYNWSSFGGGSSARNATALYVTSTGNGSNWTISGNSFYNQFIDGSGTQDGITFTPGSTSSSNVISNNYIGGSKPLCDSLNAGVPNWQNNYDDFASGLNELDVLTLDCGTVTVSGNTIKRIQNDNSDNSGVLAMWVKGSTTATISNNSFGDPAPISYRAISCGGGGVVSFSTFGGYVYGIYSSASASINASGNNFYYLFQYGAYMGGSVFGIDHESSGTCSITNNTFTGIQCAGINFDAYCIRVKPTASISSVAINNNVTDGPYINDITGAYNTTTGIFVGNTGVTTSGTINNNQIYDMRNAAYDGQVEGIWLNGTGSWTVSNNQVSLGNYFSYDTTITLGVFGIEDDLTYGAGATANYYYNSVIIGGQQGTTDGLGVDNSAAFIREPGQSGLVAGDIINLKNNIFINNRTGTGSKHWAIANYGTSNYATNWSIGAANYNFIAAKNSATTGLWGTTDQTFTSWKSNLNSNGDANSWNINSVSSGATSTAQINPYNMFTNLRLGNLNINSANQACWFVNGKGVAGASSGSITTDYGGGARGTTLGYATDIGADEFNANTGVYPIAVTATPALSTTNTFTFAGRTIGSITWGASGTVPTSVSFEYYSGDLGGTNPSPTFPTGYNQTDFHQHISATGGSGYTYNVSLYYDDADRGDFTAGNENTMMLIKTNPSNNWITRTTQPVDVVNNIVTANNLTDFSYFTGSDGSILPIVLTDFTAVQYETVDALLTWHTSSEINSDYFEVEVATETNSNGELVFRKIGEVRGNGTTIETHAYRFVDAEQGKTGIRYYRIMQVDFDGKFSYSNIESVVFEGSDLMVGSIYPNPSTDEINIPLSASEVNSVTLTFRNLAGQLIKVESKNTSDGVNILSSDVSQLAAGVYLIEISNHNSAVSMFRKFIKQ